MIADKLKLYDGKTEFMIISNRAQLRKVMYLKLWSAK